MTIFLFGDKIDFRFAFMISKFVVFFLKLFLKIDEWNISILKLQFLFLLVSRSKSYAILNTIFTLLDNKRNPQKFRIDFFCFYGSYFFLHKIILLGLVKQKLQASCFPNSHSIFLENIVMDSILNSIFTICQKEKKQCFISLLEQSHHWH